MIYDLHSLLGDVVKKRHRFFLQRAYEYHKDYEEANDIVQNAYMQILRSPPNLDEPTHLVSIILQQIKFKSYNVWKQLKKKSRIEIAVLDQQEEIVMPPTFIDYYPYSDDVFDLIPKLSPPQRMAIIGMLKELTIKEIADIYGVIPSAVYRAKERGLATLRNLKIKDTEDRGAERRDGKTEMIIKMTQLGYTTKEICEATALNKDQIKNRRCAYNRTLKKIKEQLSKNKKNLTTMNKYSDPK